MYVASFATAPTVPVLAERSEPARSTKFSFEWEVFPSACQTRPYLLETAFLPSSCNAALPEPSRGPDQDVSDTVQNWLKFMCAQDWRPSKRRVSAARHVWTFFSPNVMTLHHRVSIVWERDDCAFRLCPAIALLACPCTGVLHQGHSVQHT